MLPATDVTPACIIASGIDITERKRLEKTILDISAREQRRMGQDLHDGLGQHLTGIAFMAKVQEQKLAEKKLPKPLTPLRSSSWSMMPSRVHESWQKGLPQSSLIRMD